PSTILVRPIESDEIRTTVYPEEDLQEFILTFPADSGISPLYVVFNAKARHESGVVTGQGEDITGIWLEKAGQGLGSPIPSQIADRLRGKQFSNFDRFRKAFWLEVSKDPFLINQFNTQNQNRMRLGKSPKTRSIDKVGKRNSFEIHHVKEISKGGEVYDLDNLKLMTPKRHIDTHRG
ncbi:TPA: S-type pyocin domain-containing protein, partial [Photobacterium damselae]